MRQNSLVMLFNRLTSSTKLTNYKLFDDILECHYEKFKYLYTLLSTVNLKHIDKIYGENSSKKCLVVYIEPTENNFINEIVLSINKNRVKSSMETYFTTDVQQQKDLIKIIIEMDGAETCLYDIKPW